MKRVYHGCPSNLRRSQVSARRQPAPRLPSSWWLGILRPVLRHPPRRPLACAWTCFRSKPAEAAASPA